MVCSAFIVILNTCLTLSAASDTLSCHPKIKCAIGLANIILMLRPGFGLSSIGKTVLNNPSKDINNNWITDTIANDDALLVYIARILIRIVVIYSHNVYTKKYSINNCNDPASIFIVTCIIIVITNVPVRFSSIYTMPYSAICIHCFKNHHVLLEFLENTYTLAVQKFLYMYTPKIRLKAINNDILTAN